MPEKTQNQLESFAPHQEEDNTDPTKPWALPGMTKGKKKMPLPTPPKNTLPKPESEVKSTEEKPASEAKAVDEASSSNSAQPEAKKPILGIKKSIREIFKGAPKEVESEEITLEAVNLRFGRFGKTLLVEAVRHNNMALIKAALKAKANVNQLTDGGFSPMHAAAQFANSTECLDLLLKHGAQLEVVYHPSPSRLGSTPLGTAAAVMHQAVKEGKSDADVVAQQKQKIKWFLSNGAHPAITLGGETLLNQAIDNQWDDELFKALLDAIAAKSCQKNIRCARSPPQISVN